MAKVKITGHASGTGVLTVTAPNTSTDRTITLPDATGTLLNSDGSAASLTAIPAANITGTLPAISGANLTGLADNTPSFSAYRASGEQSVANATWTKIEFPNEHWDTDSAFDTTNDKFIVPAGEGGKYLFNYAARGESLDAGEHAMLRLYKNGSALDETRTNGYAAVDNQQVYIRGSAMLALAAADYIELWAYQNEGASRNLHNEYLHFSGMKLIGV